MTASLARVWLAAATLGAGTALGCGGSPSRIAFVASMVGAGLVARRRSSLVLLGIALLCGGAGAVNASLRCEPVTAVSVLASAVPSCRLSGRVLERAGGLGTLVSADRLTCRDHAPVARAGVVVIDEELGDLGAAIRAEGWLIPLGEDAFDDARRRLGAQAAFDPVERSVDPPRSALFTAAASIRRGLVDATRTLDPRRAGLLRGLAIGDESGLDGHTEDTFRATGLSHLLAVSGSNVAIVVATVSAGAAALGLRTRLSLCALGLGLFVLVVGPEPSVLRAAVMGGIGLATLAAGRRAEPLHALGLALVILFGLRPGIVFSVGLHLSVAATAGIVLWSQRLAARLEPFVGRAIALALGATLAAQAAVAPLLAGVFGELSVVAPAANLVAVPAVPPATVLALAAGLAGVVNPSAGAALARAAEPFAAWILGVADVAGRLSWAAVEVPTWTGIALAPPLLAAALAAVRRLEAPKLV